MDEALFYFLDELLYVAFQQKRGMDYENLTLRGLVVTEREVEQAFGLSGQERALPKEEAVVLLELASKIQQAGRREDLPFFRLCRDFRLTSLERLALLLGAAPAYHRKYEKIYGYLQDHVEIPMPTRGLCVSLAELLGETDGAEQADFLYGNGNLEFLIETGGKDAKGLSDAYEVKGRVLGYLWGSMAPAGCLKKGIEVFGWQDRLSPMEIRKEYLKRLERLWEGLDSRREASSCMILLTGREGIGKRFLLRHLAAEKKLRLLFFDMRELLQEEEEKAREKLDALYLETLLQHAYLCLTHGDTQEELQEEQRRRKEVFAYLDRRHLRFFLLCRTREDQMADFPGRKVCLELSSLTAGEKIHLWKSWACGHPLASDVDLQQNGSRYLLTPKGIQDVLSTAQLLSDMDGQADISQEHIRQAVKQNQRNQMGSYAVLIDSHFTWDDLILGEEQKRQMRMACDQMKNRAVVGEEWGFHRKTPYGRGLSVLFYGPPGTGKTMAAQVMAAELGLDLYRIDISQMLSKYIGETQKNLSRLFQKAKDINALLFFDEADSLFAKRSETKDSHDRNANAETAHLLQKLEDYEGITVLATNYMNNIDDAFKRRIKFVIHIAFPEASVRLRLWRTLLPSEARCEEELDLDFFAEHFELSGSSIKEILTNAAYLAASEHRGIKNRDLVDAVKLDYAKYGKILSKEDFGYLG